MSELWSCTILGGVGAIEVSMLDDAGQDWFADGPGGTEIGGLHEVLQVAVGHGADERWLAVVEATLSAESTSPRRSQLLIKQVTGRWFHATFARNRQSIHAHGLDYRRMIAPGIAGSTSAETAGIFLGCDLETARWFVQIGSRRGSVDIWAVDLLDTWLIGDPGAGGGGDDVWMISPDPIAASQLTLLEKDLDGGNAGP